MNNLLNGITLRRSFSLAVAIVLSMTFAAKMSSASPSQDSTQTAPVQQTNQVHSPTAEPITELDADGGQEPNDRKQMHGHKRGMHLIKDAATIIGIEPEALKKELKAGKSIAEVAKAKGIAEADLTNKMIEAKVKKIDEAVKSGKWTAERAAKMKERLPEHVREMLNHKGFHSKRDAENK